MPRTLLIGLALLLVVGVAGLALARTRQQGCPLATLSDAVRLSISPRAENSLIADATLELDSPAPVYLEYGSPALGWLRTPTTAAASSHHLPLVRLRNERQYEVRAFALDARGCPTAATSAAFTSGRLPPELDPLSISSRGQPSFPLAIMDLRLPPRATRMLVVLDEAGRPVWYYRMPDEIALGSPARSIWGLHRLSNGNWIYLASDWGVEELTPDARSVRQIKTERPSAPGIHHDLLELPDGRILYLGYEDRPMGAPDGGDNSTVRGTTLNVLDLQTGQIDVVWSAFDALDLTQRPAHWQQDQMPDDEPAVGVVDWTHGNTVSFGPRGNVILSLRNLDQVISLTPDLQRVEWRLGGVDSDFAFPDPSDRFYAQHSAYELPGGRVLMFDNGRFRPEGDYSRGLELELDFSTMTARKVWEYRHQPDVFAWNRSNIDRLPNGNTLVNFSGNAPTLDEPVVLAEARPDGTAAWTLVMKIRGQRLLRYRAHPLTSIAGEMPVEPTKLAP